MKKANLSESTVKLILVSVLVIMFLIPISLIKGLVSDRKYYQGDAVSSIVTPMGGTPEFQGIVIAVPFKIYKDVYNDKTKEYAKTECGIDYIVFVPDSYSLDINANPYYLTRGIFKVPVFNGDVKMSAQFKNFDCSHFKIAEKDIMMEDSILIIGLKNTKNLTSQPKIKINGKELLMSSIDYNSVSPFDTSIFFNLSNVDMTKVLDLSGTIAFQGGKEIRIMPIGTDNNFKMTSSWKSPGFTGGWLPNERDISDDGFTALWNIAGLSTVYSKSWMSGKIVKTPESVNISFVTPVDAYKKTERSVKYALLFLIIPFIALLVSEIFSKIRIHPVQYCLIGFANVVFYLLLLSISEHISFDITYMICSLSVCFVMFLYAMAIFKNAKWGGLLSAVQFVSFIFLYGTLQAEDYALLIGSIGLFIVVSLLMFITRKIDWYELNKKTESEDAHDK